MAGQKADCFDSFLRKAEQLGGREPETLSQGDLVELFCADCPFYHAEEEEQLECGAFRILVALVGKGTLSVEQIADALR